MTDKKIVCVDVDGTVADISHRRHFVATKPKNWKAFNASLHLDTPHADIIWLVQTLKAAGCFIIITSGRGDDTKTETVDWLNKHNVPFDAIYMRKAKDYRADNIIKQEIHDMIVAVHGKPDLAIDDRNRVVDMWRANGVRCLQVAPGDF